jgi:hypothetical protein
MAPVQTLPTLIIMDLLCQVNTPMERISTGVQLDLTDLAFMVTDVCHALRVDIAHLPVWSQQLSTLAKEETFA